MYEPWINSGKVPTTGDRFSVGNVFSLSPVQVQGTSMSDVKSTYRGK